MPDGETFNDSFFETWKKCAAKSGGNVKKLMKCAGQSFFDGASDAVKEHMIRFLCCVTSTGKSTDDPCRWGRHLVPGTKDWVEWNEKDGQCRYTREKRWNGKVGELHGECTNCCNYQSCIAGFTAMNGNLKAITEKILGGAFDHYSCIGECNGFD